MMIEVVVMMVAVAAAEDCNVDSPLWLHEQVNLAMTTARMITMTVVVL